jgi:hypothetical protein
MNRPTLAFTLILGLAFLALGSAPAQAQAAELDGACLVALDACSASCNDLGDEVSSASCLSRCNTAVTPCLGDEEPTLSSEAYLTAWGENPLSTKAAACHDLTPCPPEYGSCGSWSAFEDCGDPHCGPSTLCKICDEWGQCTAAGPATKQSVERYRVCFNAQMQGCTEYQRASQTLYCGC